MVLYIDYNNLLITETKTFYFDVSSADVDKNLKRETDHITKHNGFLVEQRS